jgi:hypothetical protein
MAQPTSMTQLTSTNGQIEFARDRIVREKMRIESLVNAAIDHAANALDRSNIDEKWFNRMCDIVDEIAKTATTRIDDEYNVLCDQYCD